MSPMNEKLKTLIIIGVVLAVVGIILAAVGFGLGGFKSVQWGPDGFYVSDIMTNSVNPDLLAFSAADSSDIQAEAGTGGFTPEGSKPSTLILISAWNAYFR